ncbi:hypothetical protein C8Q80DRAFT_122863 [Daedaleopsis nitida]|nr:hypothetical protein C8Q80DRAFT_122863 [Daedaleopsis nitida]
MVLTQWDRARARAHEPSASVPVRRRESDRVPPMGSSTLGCDVTYEADLCDDSYTAHRRRSNMCRGDRKPRRPRRSELQRPVSTAMTRSRRGGVLTSYYTVTAAEDGGQMRADAVDAFSVGRHTGRNVGTRSSVGARWIPTRLCVSPPPRVPLQHPLTDTDTHAHAAALQEVRESVTRRTRVMQTAPLTRQPGDTHIRERLARYAAETHR